MKNHMQSLGAAFAMTLCVALAAGSGLAQDVPNASSDRDASRADGARDESRTSTAPAGALGMTARSLDVGLNPDAVPIRLEGGLTGLQRRANRKTLIASAPKIPWSSPAAVGVGAPFTPPGANVGR